MSFTADTKNEITHGRVGKPCCKAAEVAGFVRARGSVVLRGGEAADCVLILTTDNSSVARYIKTLLSERFGASASLGVGKSGFGKNNRVYKLRILPEKGVERVLEEADVLPGLFSGATDERIYGKKCCRKAYLKGLF
ncbi:MAG: DNA-binding protein WhiA, partial [Clostridiales Family XIII bacterium]|nr:DNA-binding protein WhiA [Clostridiales Family XIII bacterium]